MMEKLEDSRRFNGGARSTGVTTTSLKSQENRHHGWLACSFSCFCDLLPPLPDLSTRTQQELGATGNFSAPSCVVIGMVYQLDSDTSYHN
jgi:hypothetical protein